MKSKYKYNTTPQRSKLMKKIKSKDTKPEKKLRKKLWDLGYRYRKNYKELPGKPDIVFLKKKIAIFADGEFWHGYNWNSQKQKFNANKDFWINKIEMNIKRDRKVNKKLEDNGWIVLRFWEREIEKDLNKCIQRIEEAVRKRKTSRH